MKTYLLFEMLASTTWRTINSTYHNRVQLGEDAITSYNLNALACAGPLNVTFEDTRVNESTKGCDFELWIGSDAMGWYRYAVQAKKITVRTGRYDQLGHKVGGVLQLDILERYAKANNAVPLYCFYNHFGGKVPWNCNYPPDVEQLGCSITPSKVVRAALKKRGARTFTYIHKQSETLPWRCLVKCPKLIPSKSTSAISPGAPHLFPKLPGSLSALRKVRRENAEIDRGELFNFDVELFPRYIAVVDLGHLASEEG